jgi:hypothetical protein
LSKLAKSQSSQNLSTSVNSSDETSARFHIGGSIGPTIWNIHNAPRFHGGGQMWNGSGMKGGGELKPGERMIIAEDGEFVINKRDAMKIGRDNLQKLNRGEATVTPKFHFGGMIQVFNHAVAPLVRFHDGGLIDSSDIASVPEWSSGRTDAPSSMTFQAATIPQNTLTGGIQRSGNGPSANIAVFNNPQFQNRQSVGQTSAQLTAAMEAGKRNR